MSVQITMGQVWALRDAQVDGWRDDVSGGVIVTTGAGVRWYVEYERGEVLDVRYHSMVDLLSGP